jgi:hypothetical protein
MCRRAPLLRVQRHGIGACCGRPARAGTGAGAPTGPGGTRCLPGGALRGRALRGRALRGRALRFRAHVVSSLELLRSFLIHTASGETHGKPNPDRLNVNGLWMTHERAALTARSGAGENAARSAGCVHQTKGARVHRRPLRRCHAAAHGQSRSAWWRLSSPVSLSARARLRPRLPTWLWTART